MPDVDRVGGRYRLGRKLASGGMGAVWEGWDLRLHRTIAIKRLHLQPWLSDAERNVGVQRAMREARITARLQHPNVVQVFDVVEDEDAPCLIMEYVPSSSLHDIIRDRGPLPPLEVARIGAQVAAGLAAAHAAGVVHRDVKPGNVLIVHDGSAKVSDFGISRAFGDATVTSAGLLVGTPAYLAPELARGAPPSFASDVYGLGATLYMAAEGKPPFGTDDNPMAVLHRVASGQWDPPERSGVLTPLLSRMMAVDPHARPAMPDVVAALRQMLTVAPAGENTTQVIREPTAPLAPLPHQPAPTTTQLRRRRNRSLLLPLLILVLVLALGGTAAWLLLSGNSNNGTPAAGQTNGVRHTGGPVQHRSSEHVSTTPNPPPTSPSQRSTSTTRPASGSATAQQLADAVSEYFQLVPNNLDAAWNRLTPNFQNTRAGGRGNFDRYWNTVESVDVLNVSGLPPNGAVATLLYHYKDGRDVTDRTTFTLVRQGGVLKIDTES